MKASESKLSRRGFLKRSIGAGTLLGFPTIIPGSALGKNGSVAPSERVNVGVISCGAQSGAAGRYKQYEKSQIVAVCDPVLDRRVARAKEWGVDDHYNDFRELLARKDVDAVHISTPDHWHVPISLAAARAGKDVYCEKPLGLSIEQDLASREIVTKHKRVFQYGTQQRSHVHLRMGQELLMNDHIGEVEEVYVWAPGGVSGGSATPVIPVPEGFDYDLWLGPAPEAPFGFDRCLSRDYKTKGAWYIYDYAIGFLGGWGAHPMDQLQWWADREKLGIPEKFKASGRIPKEGLFNTVTRWDMECRYANGLMMYFMDSETAREPGSRVPLKEELKEFNGDCTLFMGSKGWIAMGRGKLKASSPEILRKGKNPGPERLLESNNHQGNFVDCIISREQPIASLDSAVKSDIICHMADLCIRSGEELAWDPVKETVVGSRDAVKMMHRPMRAPWTL